MLTKRIIVCLDVRNKKVTKGVQFKQNEDLGDPIQMGIDYYKQGVDELVFYDITASAEKRSIDFDIIEKVAENIFIPFTVGGGLRNLDDMKKSLNMGAEKLSLNSLAIKDPKIISQGAKQFGNQCIVVSIDVKKVTPSANIPSGYEVYLYGGREKANLDAVAWAKQVEELGSGEICLNSIDTDGAKQGYEKEITQQICDAVSIPVIASGGAGEPNHISDLFQNTSASAALIASMVHYKNYSLKEIKEHLNSHNIATRF